MKSSPCYFGQPSAGFFFANDFFTASRQFPSNLRRSGLGPRVAFFLEWFELLTAFFLLTTVSVLPLGKWLFVHQALPLC